MSHIGNQEFILGTDSLHVTLETINKHGGDLVLSTVAHTEAIEDHNRLLVLLRRKTHRLLDICMIIILV